MPRGKFITLEGGEGAGKSTQIRLLAQHLKKSRDIVVTREPGGSPGAEEIRQLLVTGAAGRWDATTETLLHFAARRDHVERVVRPALAAGSWVLCDRFADSTRAYQGYGHGVDLALIDHLYDLVLGEFRPDLTLILDLPVELGLARARARADGEDRYESLPEGFHARLRAGFQDIARREPGRCRLLDASGGVEAVHQQILAVLERLSVDKAP